MRHAYGTALVVSNTVTPTKKFIFRNEAYETNTWERTEAQVTPQVLIKDSRFVLSMLLLLLRLLLFGS